MYIYFCKYTHTFIYYEKCFIRIYVISCVTGLIVLLPRPMQAAPFSFGKPAGPASVNGGEKVRAHRHEQIIFFTRLSARYIVLKKKSSERHVNAISKFWEACTSLTSSECYGMPC